MIRQAELRRRRMRVADDVAAPEAGRELLDLMLRQPAGRDFDGFDAAFPNGDEAEQAFDDLDVRDEPAQAGGQRRK